jgi:preprotein translocase subunit SecF
MEFIRYDINKYTPVQMVTIPLLLLVLSIALLSFNFFATGMPVNPGIDFAGGTAVTIFTSETEENIAAYFTNYHLLSVEEGVNNGWYLKFEKMNDQELQALAAHISERYPDAKIDQIGETFGKTLQQQALLALIFSFIGMSVVVFIAFRAIVPSFAVVLSAFADIVITAAIMNMIGISLSLGTTAALLMLIGYSVDSDVLLTTRVLKRKGKLEEKLEGAYHTGMIMTTTTLAALAAMWVVSFLGSVQIIMEISTVLIIGLVVDLMNTWLTNAGLLKWYVSGRAAR